MKYKLEELAQIKYGKNQKNVISEQGHIPIYGTGGLMAYATESLYDKPSVLIGRKGTIDKVRYVTHPFWTVDTLFYTVINENIIYPQYFYYLLKQVDLSKYNEGTTIPSLRTETLNRIKFEVPSLNIQSKILALLRPIEDKITVNIKINDNLSYAMSRAKLRKNQPSGACSCKAVCFCNFIGRTPDSERLCLERRPAVSSLLVA